MKWTSQLFTISLIQYGFIAALIGLNVLSPPTPSACIITIDGVRYDVTPFITLHQGGNIFQCNTDMSQVFHQQHTLEFLEKLVPYRLD